MHEQRKASLGVVPSRAIVQRYQLVHVAAAANGKARAKAQRAKCNAYVSVTGA